MHTLLTVLFRITTIFTLAALLGSWGPCASCVADLTGDGSVLADDLAIVLSSWGAGQGGCGAQ